MSGGLPPSRPALLQSERSHFNPGEMRAKVNRPGKIAAEGKALATMTSHILLVATMQGVAHWQFCTIAQPSSGTACSSVTRTIKDGRSTA